MISVEMSRSVSTIYSKDATVGNIDAERDREQQKHRQGQSQLFKGEKGLDKETTGDLMKKNKVGGQFNGTGSAGSY